MPFTHYPKLADGLIFAWRLPAPPDKPGFLNQRRFSRANRAVEELAPGKSWVAYHEAQNFTRFLGSIQADQPLETTFVFSNDDVTDEGDVVTDENIHTLHYDAEALRQAYDPAKQSATGKYLVTIYGRWLRVEVKNVGTGPVKNARVYVRGSVF